MEDLLAIRGRQGLDLAQPVPQAGIGAGAGVSTGW
jgi:hypothetical protein